MLNPVPDQEGTTSLGSTSLNSVARSETERQQSIPRNLKRAHFSSTDNQHELPVRRLFANAEASNSSGRAHPYLNTGSVINIDSPIHDIDMPQVSSDLQIVAPPGQNYSQVSMENLYCRQIRRSNYHGILLIML